jgi:phosphoserine phosphatase
MTSSSPRVIFLVRHTQTTWNVLSRYQGRIDTPLSDLGRQQLEQITRLVRPGALDAVYSSPLTRARVLADSMGAAAGAPIRQDQRITEIAMGPWEGLTRDQIEKQYGEMLRMWHHRPDQVGFPEGETLAAVADRVRSFIGDRFAADQPARIAVVSHDVVVKVALMQALGLDLRYLHRFRMRNGSISVLRGSRFEGSVESIGQIAHLTGSPFELPE